MQNLQNTQQQYNENENPAHQLKVSLETNYSLKLINMRKLHSEGLSLKYDHDGVYLAIGCKNGTKLLYDLDKDKITNRIDDPRQNSITSLKWRPNHGGNSNILASVDAGGYITYSHVPTLKTIFTILEHNNSIHSIDFSPNANRFATGGKDCHIRIYDEQTKSIISDLHPAGWNNVGHDNRIFAVKFIDDNTIISGGWDSVIHIWDIRQSKSSRHFYGPNISGESLDYQDGKILTGNYSATNQIQIWDFKSLHKIQQIDWTGNIDDAQYIYTASFNRRNPTIFGAGSTGAHSQIRLFQQNQQGKYKIVNKIQGLSQGCFSLDFSNKKDQFAFTTPHHGFYIYGYTKK